MPGWESMEGLVKVLGIEGWCGKKIDGRVLSGSVNDARVFVPLCSQALVDAHDHGAVVGQ
jgi:hypothetical protein